MQLIVQTTGSFMLMVPGGPEVDPETPTLVRPGHFVEERVAMGHLRVLGQVNDEATAAELKSYLDDSQDDELAVSAFLDAYAVRTAVVATEAEEPKKGTRGKGRV